MILSANLWLTISLMLISFALGNEDAKRLYDDLMIRYNRLSRPSSNPHIPITIKLKLRLSQIIDVHEIDQIMTCSVWLRQEWIDEKLSWDPKRYGGVNVLYVPYEMIWVPDIVLYNNADNNYNITISTKATLRYDGVVTWEPPAIFKSMCQMDVRWFPFDEQKCHLKFGSWTYSDNLLDLKLLGGKERYELETNKYGEIDNITIIDDGIGTAFLYYLFRILISNFSINNRDVISDLSDYYPSVEWDIMSRVAKRRSKTYPSCCPKNDAYVDIMFYLELRRKPLFYTVNLVFPCVGISFLTILVFYLPSRSGEKIALCISILFALTIFFLLLTEIIPATSISLPLIGKYLLFTMVMVTLSVVVTVVCDKLLMNYHEYRVSPALISTKKLKLDDSIQKIYHSPLVIKAFKNICIIADLLKKKDHDDKILYNDIFKIDEDWRYVAMVLDRLFLLIFSLTCFFGTVTILLQVIFSSILLHLAPSLYDNRKAIDLQYRPTNSTSSFTF
ncbi:unnamed protein product [Dracunculus medinensis]|uniref:Acetylcholine receptor subunit alpha-type unc-38 n=1 Tax=Dracunculus medinensis TaxID=318479 RepID=A0A158Q4A8_DRAME|nr:unnamed protein product [Dracunculus medinensis]